MPHEIIPYEENFGPISWQDGFREELTGKTFEEQALCYAWAKSALADLDTPYTRYPDDCMENPRYAEYIEPLSDTDALIVKDGLVVGAAHPVYRFDDASNSFVLRYLHVMPYGRYCYDTSSDNNGAGTKERAWYKYLMCLPTDHDLWK